MRKSNKAVVVERTGPTGESAAPSATVPRGSHAEVTDAAEADTAQNLAPGLYIVATPIGNLGDISTRAADILARVDVVAAEDSRVTAKLLNHLNLRKTMIAYHDHADERVRQRLLGLMRTGAVALVSDAGTPLISDPGFKLVRSARAEGLAVTTLPGPCAAIAALTLSGLPTDRFLFMGFLPPKDGARTRALAEVVTVKATLIFYESGPRLGRMLAALGDVLGDRDAAVVREISKLHEDCASGPLSVLAERYRDSPPKGEIVVVVGPPNAMPDQASDSVVESALSEALLTQSPANAARAIAARFGRDRPSVYALAVALKARL